MILSVQSVLEHMHNKPSLKRGEGGETLSCESEVFGGNETVPHMKWCFVACTIYGHAQTSQCTFFLLVDMCTKKSYSTNSKKQPYSQFYPWSQFSRQHSPHNTTYLQWHELPFYSQSCIIYHLRISFNIRYAAGDHGYDPDKLDMQGVFVAQGPAFQKQMQVPELTTVDMYALMCEVSAVCAYFLVCFCWEVCVC